jgi:hypothetical protein
MIPFLLSGRSIWRRDGFHYFHLFTLVPIIHLMNKEVDILNSINAEIVHALLAALPTFNRKLTAILNGEQ